jgi:hypothetical protein
VSGQGVRDVPRVFDLCWLEEHYFHLFVSDRPVLDTPRDNDEISLLEQFHAITKFHPESATNHKEQLILVRVIVPNELTSKLD